MENEKLKFNPGSVFLTTGSKGVLVDASFKNGGDDNFIRYMLDALDRLTPGEPIPGHLITRYDMGDLRWELPSLDESSKDEYVNLDFLPFIRKHNIPIKQQIMLADAAYCVGREIPLLDAADSPRAFAETEDYRAAIEDLYRAAPALTENIARLRAALPQQETGCVYYTFDSALGVMDVELVGKDGMSWYDYVQRNLDRLVPGKALPPLLITRLDLEDIAPLKNCSQEDAHRFIRDCAIPLMLEQGKEITASHWLDQIIYCIKHGINPLTTSVDDYASPGYFKELSEIRKSVPPGLSVKTVNEHRAVKHVSSLSANRTKLTPKK